MDSSTTYQMGKDVGILQANIEVLSNEHGKRLAAIEQHLARSAAADQEEDNIALGQKLAELEELRKRVAEFEAKTAPDSVADAPPEHPEPSPLPVERSKFRTPLPWEAAKEG